MGKIIERDALVCVEYDDNGVMTASWVALLDNATIIDAETENQLSEPMPDVNWTFALRTASID